jgi:hypothetical protein
MPPAALTVVGTGIRLSQLSVESQSQIESAEKLFFLVADPVTHAWIMDLRPEAESLAGCYSPDKLRRTSYEDMVERILVCVREGLRVCALFYGHPGVFGYPAHEAVRRVRLAGYRAEMLPAVSAEDCLFADVGVDPGQDGCQSFEATDFLISRRRFDPRVPLVLWQIGLVGEFGYKPEYSLAGLRVLVEVLLESYEETHEVAVYVAARFLGCEPSIQRIALASVPEAKITPVSTLYVPPKSRAVPDAEMIVRLGVSLADLGLAAAGADGRC